MNGLEKKIAAELAAAKALEEKYKTSPGLDGLSPVAGCGRTRLSPCPGRRSWRLHGITMLP